MRSLMKSLMRTSEILNTSEEIVSEALCLPWRSSNKGMCEMDDNGKNALVENCRSSKTVMATQSVAYCYWCR